MPGSPQGPAQVQYQEPEHVEEALMWVGNELNCSGSGQTQGVVLKTRLQRRGRFLDERHILVGAPWDRRAASATAFFFFFFFNLTTHEYKAKFFIFQTGQ